MSTLTKQQIENIIKVLEDVPDDIQQTVISMAKGMTVFDIVQSFNQIAQDLFDLLITITKNLKSTHKKMSGNQILTTESLQGHKMLFDSGMKMNMNLPIEHTLVILLFAPQIYNQDEECFMKMDIPDSKVQSGKEFNLIRSSEFKNLWNILNEIDKDDVKDKVILLTTYANAYFYKTLLKF
jgi:hypothetical protein